MLANIMHSTRQFLLLLPPNSKRCIQLLFDAVLFSMAFAICVLIRLGFDQSVDVLLYYPSGLCIVFLSLFSMEVFRAGNIAIRHFSLRSVYKLVNSVALASLLSFIFIAVNFIDLPRAIPFLYLFIGTFSLIFSRLLVNTILNKKSQGRSSTVAIIGCGDLELYYADALQRRGEFLPLVLVDEDRNYTNSDFAGFKVTSPQKAIKLLERGTIELIAVKDGAESIQKAILMFPDYVSRIRTFASSPITLDVNFVKPELRPLTVDSILGRETIKPIPELMRQNVKGKTVLVTGAGGSIGQELCRQVLTLEANAIILYESSEYALYTILSELTALKEDLQSEIQITEILDSVVNMQRLNEVMEEGFVDTVFHCAAYKHVPLVEKNITSAFENNVIGTYRVAAAAVKSNVKKFVLISTDKAVRPTNFMGATKRLTELCCQELARKKTTNTSFCVVRFGNVIGSSGSVIPLFSAQIKNRRPVTVTHPEIERYFMTIPEASQLVIQASSIGDSGDVFVLDMGKPVKIIDLAARMIRSEGLEPCFDENFFDVRKEIMISYTGLRPGEKLYEELSITNDLEPTIHPRIRKANEPKHVDSDIESIMHQFEECEADKKRDFVAGLLTSSVTAYKNPLFDI